MIKYIVIIIIIIALLSYFGISIKAIIESDTFQENFNYVWTTIKYVWGTYLTGPANYLWNDIFIDLIWDSFIENMKRIKEGNSPEIMDNAPQAIPTQ